jgi:hypothetical protein
MILLFQKGWEFCMLLWILLLAGKMMIEAGASLELQGLIDKTMQGSQHKCMLEEYVTGDCRRPGVREINRSKDRPAAPEQR